MIEDIQNQKQPVTSTSDARINKRFKALSDGYVGLIHYNRWKNSTSSLDAVSSSQPLDGELRGGEGEKEVSLTIIIIINIIIGNGSFPSHTVMSSCPVKPFSL